MNPITQLHKNLKLQPEIFNPKDLDELYKFIVETIQTSYFGYYPEEAIHHFIEYSNKQGILADAQRNHVIVVKNKNKIVGTGTLKYTHIQRVFVSPNEQGKGLGKLIMNELETVAKENNLKLVELHSSLFAKRFYDNLEYKMFKIGKVAVENGELLYYQRMAKIVGERPYSTEFDFHKKHFKVVPGGKMVANTNLEPTFLFYQNNALIYAEYKTEEIVYGELFGLIENQTIHFYYTDEDLNGVKRQGNSTGTIVISEHNKLQITGKLEFIAGPGLSNLQEI